MKSELTDEEIIRIYLVSQPRYCYEILYKRYHQKVYKQCLSMTQDTEQARDFTQDIFIKVFHKLDAFQQRYSFSTWIYSIAHNYCSDQIRRTKRLPVSVINEYLDMPLIDKTETLTQEDIALRFNRAMESRSLMDQHMLRLKYDRR